MKPVNRFIQAGGDPEIPHLGCSDRQLSHQLGSAQIVQLTAALLPRKNWGNDAPDGEGYSAISATMRGILLSSYTSYSPRPLSTLL